MSVQWQPSKLKIEKAELQYHGGTCPLSAVTARGKRRAAKKQNKGTAVKEISKEETK